MPATNANDVSFYHPTIALLGRVMFTLIFFLSGITQLGVRKAAPRDTARP